VCWDVTVWEFWYLGMFLFAGKAVSHDAHVENAEVWYLKVTRGWQSQIAQRRCRSNLNSNSCCWVKDVSRCHITN
jgi:hypothetical protein